MCGVARSSAPTSPVGILHLGGGFARSVFRIFLCRRRSWVAATGRGQVQRRRGRTLGIPARSFDLLIGEAAGLDVGVGLAAHKRKKPWRRWGLLTILVPPQSLGEKKSTVPSADGQPLPRASRLENFPRAWHCVYSTRSVRTALGTCVAPRRTIPLPLSQHKSLYLRCRLI